MQSLLILIYQVINLYIYVVVASAIFSWLIAFNVINPQNRFCLLGGRYSLPADRTSPAAYPADYAGLGRRGYLAGCAYSWTDFPSEPCNRVVWLGSGRPLSEASLWPAPRLDWVSLVGDIGMGTC